MRKLHDSRWSIRKVFLVGIAITSICCATPAYSEVRWKRQDLFQNSGGLNNAFSPIAIEVNEAADLQNVVISTGGSVLTRDGFDNVNTSSTAIATGLKFFKPVSGSRFLVGVFADDKIKKMDYDVGGGPDGVYDDITGSLTFSVDQDDLSSFTIGEDMIIIEDGLNTTPPFIWTSTNLTALAMAGSPPNATMVAFHKLHAFAAGDTAAPSKLSFSDLGNVQQWTGGLSGNVDVETNDGSVIRAIEPGFDSLYIWKDSSIWRLSGDDKDNFVLQRMVEGIGCLSVNCVSLIGNDFIFFDGKGDVYIYDGGIKVRLISSKIEGTTDEANFSRFNKVSSVEFEKDFYVSLSSAASTENDTILVFDTFHLAWVKFDGFDANAMTVGEDSNGKQVIFFQDYFGFTQQFPSGTNDDGRGITAFYLTKQFRFPEIEINKTYQKTYVYAGQKGNYNLNVELRADFQSSGTTQSINLGQSTSAYGSAIYGTDVYGGENLIIGNLEWGTEGSFFQLNFSNTKGNLDEPFDIKGYQHLVDGDDAI